MVKGSSAGDCVVLGDIVGLSVVVVVVVVGGRGVVVGTFRTTIGFFFWSCAACTCGFFVITGDWLGNGFLVVDLGGEILIWINLSSARVVAGRRVLIAGGRGRFVVVLFPLRWLKAGGSRCGIIGPWTGSLVAGVLRGGDGLGDVELTFGVFAGFFVITGTGFLVLVVVLGGLRLLLLLVVTGAAGVVVLTLFTDWNVVNSSISTDDVVSSFFCSGGDCVVVAAGNGTRIVVGLLEDGRLDEEVAVVAVEGVEPVAVLSFWAGSRVESVAKTVVP